MIWIKSARDVLMLLVIEVRTLVDDWRGESS